MSEEKLKMLNYVKENGDKVVINDREANVAAAEKLGWKPAKMTKAQTAAAEEAQLQAEIEAEELAEKA